MDGLQRGRLAYALRAAVLLLVLWLVVDGTGNLLVGALAAGLGAAVAAAFPPAQGFTVRWLAVPAFAAFFVYESIRGAVDVAWRAGHPRLPIDPHLLRHVIRLPAGPPRTLLVSTVSLLPGTLSADLLAEDNVLIVHAITSEPQAGLQRLERRIASLFGLRIEGLG
ncbi:MAG: cation transporter [Gammaproteobacteria bacterium]|nr:MAG: cation transporter [Gammaproteobacteria bacterium]